MGNIPFKEALVNGVVLFGVDALARVIPGFNPILIFFLSGLTLAWVDANMDAGGGIFGGKS